MKLNINYEDGIRSKVEFYGEDGTLDEVDIYEDGEYKNSIEMKVVE